MHVSLSLGPLTLPTSPILAILAALLCLEVAARAGRRFGLRADDVWNTGLIAIIAGLIVARLWNVIQFADIYRNDPWLAISPRPSGFALLPGLVAALIAGYANLVRKALDPVPVAAAFALGLAAASVVTNLSDRLTGAVVGNPSVGPLAVRYFYEMVQPTALLRMGIMFGVTLIAWFTLQAARPTRTLLIVLLGYGLMLLATEPFVRDPALWGVLQRTQVVGLLLSLAAAVGLTLEARRARGIAVPTLVVPTVVTPNDLVEPSPSSPTNDRA